MVVIYEARLNTRHQFECNFKFIYFFLTLSEVKMEKKPLEKIHYFISF